MTLEESDASLDDLLFRWHRWQQSYRAVSGWRRSSLVLDRYVSGRHYDADNGALDDEIEADTMHTMEFEVGEMPEPWRSAIHQEARNMVVGAAVFVSPRLPSDLRQRQRVIAEARQKLRVRLLSAGLL